MQGVVIRFVTFVLLAITLPVAATAAPAPPQPYKRSRVIVWNNHALEAIRLTRMAPPMAARALAIVHTCIYDAWAAYDDTALGTRFGDALRRPEAERTERRKRIAVSYAAYRALVDLFPTKQARFDARMVKLGLDPLNTTTDLSTPEGIGNVACAAVLEARHADGANQLGDLNAGAPYSDYTGYEPVNTPTAINDPNRWQPITYDNGATPPFLAPHWGSVAPFALGDGEALMPKPPPLYPDRAYLKQAEEILSITARLDDREKAIAEYWADGPNSVTPPGHWNLFAHVVSKKRHLGLDDDARLYFALGNALLDASIAVWECKRYYDYARPITAIRFLYAGQMVNSWAGPGLGTRPIDGSQWRPYQPGTFLTPPFAEYVSGHSTFSAAAAEILKRFTGSDTFKHKALIAAGSSKVEPGLTPAKPIQLSWKTFSDAADEAGMSRRYGGIHFKSGDEEGRRMGREIGERVWRKVEALGGKRKPPKG